jgi:hypothetical protein
MLLLFKEAITMATRTPQAGVNRRTLITLPLLALAGLPLAASAKNIRKLGVFSLLGDGLQLVFAAPVTDTRLDRNMRESLPTKEIGFDQAALRAITRVMNARQPQAQLQMFRATSAIPLADQRAVADGAARAELPAWMIEAINRNNLTHILLLTRNRGDARFPVNEGFSVGRGTVEGIGYYLDNTTDVRNAATGMVSTGFLGAYMMVRVQLMEVASGDLVGSDTIRVGQMFAGRKDTEAANIWNALDPQEKVDVLRQMVESNVERVLPGVLGG